tara:strand:- start:103 stop:306 length:204 start_codon:yes stop_codon:yes gene_type:complete
MKNRFICKVCVGETELHSKEYRSLKEIAEDLGLSYQQAADISVGRLKKFVKGSFKYQPTIDIQKISV